MEKYVKSSRLVAMALVLALLLTAYALTLYRIEKLDVQALMDTSGTLTATTTTVKAARGPILDRNGTLLVSDREVHDVTLIRSALLSEEDPNGTVLKLLNKADELGIAHTDTFPVTKTAPFEFDAYASATQRSWMKEYYAYFKNSLTNYFERDIDVEAENAGLTATELISWMREHYSIPYTVPAEDARRIIGVRWELEIRVPVRTNDYVFAEDVPDELVSYIAEQNMTSVSISTRSVREYHTEYAAHLLGYVGAVTRDQYNDTYKALGYPLTAQIGQSGVEAAFERYLHGTDGKMTVYRDASGAVNDVRIDSEARAGNCVFLTIDIGLQAATEAALETRITEINDDRIQKAIEETPPNEAYQEPELARGGAAVMVDVKTGEVLAMASYPSYAPAEYYTNYAQLSTDTVGSPLTNRAIQGIYNPGSTFKMVTAYAGLSNGIISVNTTFDCTGRYMEYAENQYTPRCTGRHGPLNVVGGLEKSCNVFFFSVGDKLGITRMEEATRLFGFGQRTGIELNDKAGYVASRERKKEAGDGDGWYAADNLITAIGQGYNEFTPLQMANYVSTIANGGTLNNLTVLRNVSSFDYSDVLLRREPSSRYTIEDPQGIIPVLQRGMKAVAKTGTAHAALANYQVAVAAKTGTVQSSNSAVNNGVFVCYAPADDPQIAIAVVVEKGGSGSALISIAKDMMDAYFADSEMSSLDIYTDNSLLR